MTRLIRGPGTLRLLLVVTALLVVPGQVWLVDAAHAAVASHHHHHDAGEAEYTSPAEGCGEVAAGVLPLVLPGTAGVLDSPGAPLVVVPRLVTPSVPVATVSTPRFLLNGSLRF
jgi:hypothetical protein